MWRISIQDLRHRRRRFVLAVVATGLAFGMSLLMQGFVTTLGWESRHIVGLFGADEWVVAAGGTGPFTTMTFIDASVVDEFRSQPGVRAAGALAREAREILHGLDTFVIGVEPGGLGVPVAADGRAPTAPGEVMTATMLGYHLGDEIQLAGRARPRWSARWPTAPTTLVNPSVRAAVGRPGSLLGGAADRQRCRCVRNVEPPAGIRVLPTSKRSPISTDRRNLDAKASRSSMGCCGSWPPGSWPRWCT